MTFDRTCQMGNSPVCTEPPFLNDGIVQVLLMRLGKRRQGASLDQEGNEGERGMKQNCL
jgi:hypothetical protein